jgi:hypothetical protein
MVDLAISTPAEVIRKVIIESGIPIDSSEKVQPSLEDVFVAATQARKAERGLAA